MDNLSSVNRWERWVPFFVLISAFSFALVGLNPTFYVDDSPETITACVTLGIPHPPGYPLHTLLGHFFSLLPLAHFPFRINLFSAVLGASVCGFLFLFLKEKLGVSPRLAGVFALLWIVGVTAYPAALSAKTGIYQLTTLFLLGILWFLFEGRWGLAFFLIGASFANHWMTMLTFLPGIGWFLYQHEKETGFDGKRLLRGLTFLLLGLSVYLFLPFRALQNPLLNWGNPSTWSNFLFDFLRSQYLDPEAAGGTGTRFLQGWVYLKTYFLEFAGLLLPAIWGFIKVHQKYPSKAKGLGLLWLGLVLTLGLYLNLPKEQFYLISNYTLPGQLFTLLFFAWGLEIWLSEKEPVKRVFWEKVSTGSLALLLIGLSMSSLSLRRQTEYTYGYDSVLNSFKGVPRNSLYFCKGDAVVFPAWYFQWVEHRRADLAVVGIDGLPMEWIRRNLAVFHPGLKVPHTEQRVGLESIPSMAHWLLEKNPDREVYFSYNQIDDGSIPGEKIVPYGMSGKGLSPGQIPVLDDQRALYLWDHLRLRHLQEAGLPMDERTRELTYRDYSVFRNSLGIYCEDAGDDAKSRLTPKTNAQDLLMMGHDYQMCFDNFQWAQQWDTENPLYAYNLGNAYYHLGRLEDSLIWYEKATQLNPKYTIAYGNWAVAALQLREYEKAGELFEKVLELKPGDAQALRGLDYLKQIGQSHS